MDFLGLHEDLHGGQKTLLALQKDLSAMLAKGLVPEGHWKGGGKKLGAPSLLTGITMGVIVGVNQVGLLTSSAGSNWTMVACDFYAGRLGISFQADSAFGVHCIL